jgi:hypothetical protein
MIGHVEPADVLAEGNEILAAVLRPAGFEPGSIESGHGSGGPFATTRWTRGNQAIEISFRTSLGMVVYSWGDEKYEHRHVVGALRVTASYPGFSTDPLDGFRHLTADLAGPLAPVLLDDTTETLARIRDWHPATTLP